MANWILILTLIGSRADAGMAITAVPSFNSEAACMAAANAWLKQIKGFGWKDSSAFCVPKS